MAPASPSQNLASWFAYLRQFQEACSFNKDAAKMDLLTFANAKITRVLPSATEQGQFMVAVANTPGDPVSNADLTTYATFEALLDHFSPLPTYVGVYLQTLAVAPYPAGPSADFWKARVADAFPGGSKGKAWTTALGCLASVMPAVCFTSAFQQKVAKTVDGATIKMSDVITQIAGLG